MIFFLKHMYTIFCEIKVLSRNFLHRSGPARALCPTGSQNMAKTYEW